MRILHVVASLAPRHGGPTSAAFGMVKALRDQGVDASLLSSDDDVGGALDQVRLRLAGQHLVGHRPQERRECPGEIV